MVELRSVRNTSKCQMDRTDCNPAGSPPSSARSEPGRVSNSFKSSSLTGTNISPLILIISAEVDQGKHEKETSLRTTTMCPEPPPAPLADVPMPPHRPSRSPRYNSCRGTCPCRCDARPPSGSTAKRPSKVIAKVRSPLCH